MPTVPTVPSVPTDSSARPSRLAAVLALAAVVLAVVVGTVTGAFGAAPRSQVHDPPPDTIVAVDGDKRSGFTVHFHDGSALFPPTASEARAECREPVTRVARVRCRTEARVWYRDLGDLKQALEHAHHA